jgi:hypothetical protein
MCKRNFVKSVLIETVCCGVAGTSALASSVSIHNEVYVAESPQVLMGDGKNLLSKGKVDPDGLLLLGSGLVGLAVTLRRIRLPERSGPLTD